MKCYYAHCMALYDTPQEERDIATLEGLGFKVENPNSPLHKEESEGMSSPGIMAYFCDRVRECDVLAFRALPDGRIPAGVQKEIDQAICSEMPVIELPNALLGRRMTVEETREYLRDSGQR